MIRSFLSFVAHTTAVLAAVVLILAALYGVAVVVLGGLL